VKANTNHLYIYIYITCPYMSFFSTKSTFLVLLPNISNIKKALKTCSYQTCNGFSVTVLLTKAYRQKLYFPPQSQTGSKPKPPQLSPNRNPKSHIIPQQNHMGTTTDYNRPLNPFLKFRFLYITLFD
jgi:hypothetical protein